MWKAEKDLQSGGKKYYDGNWVVYKGNSRWVGGLLFKGVLQSKETGKTATEVMEKIDSGRTGPSCD